MHTVHTLTHTHTSMTAGYPYSAVRCTHGTVTQGGHTPADRDLDKTPNLLASYERNTCHGT